MTPFEQAVENARAGKTKVPVVSTQNGKINFFKYQLTVHRMNLGIMSMGITCRGVKFTQIKKYYGLKGRSAKECKPQLDKLLETWEF